MPQTYKTFEERWNALLTRDADAREAFLYAVKTTGVYCRPLCGSRPPKKENVAFFATTGEAQKAGYRACKHCKPDVPLIRYEIVRSSLGLVLVAVSAKGVCHIELGTSRAVLAATLKAAEPSARISPARKTMPETATVVATIEGETARHVALDASGTSFQTAVWNALKSVPRGETRTYAELAAEIGQPKASRAVALACAANRLAVLVPCHRIIRGDGSLSGYRWGVERKRALLAREGVEIGR